MRYFKSINLVIGVILGYISPKAFPKDCCYLWCLEMTQVIHLSSRWNKFLVSSFISIQFFFPWVAGCHLIIWDGFHKTISRLFFSLLVFQQLCSSLCCKRAPSRSCFSSFIPFHSFFCSRGIVMLIFSTHHLVFQRSCFFHDWPFNRSVVPSFQVLSPYQVLIQFLFFSIGVLPEVVLPCSSFLTECFQLRSSLLFSLLKMA